MDANDPVVEESTFDPVGASVDPSAAAIGRVVNSECTATSPDVEAVTAGVTPEARGEDDKGVDPEGLEREGDEDEDDDDML